MSDPRLCIVCARTELEPTERQTCVGCLARTRSALAEIVEKYAELPAELTGHIGAARAPDAVGQVDSDGLPEALVLLAGGSNGTVTASRTGDRSHAADHWHADPPSVVAVLAWWEDDWRGPNVAQQEATVATCAVYLTEHLSWAAQNHPAFDEFASDIRKLRGQVVAAVRDGEPIDRGKRIPCPGCGERLIRRYRKARRCTHQTPVRDRSEPYELFRQQLDRYWEIHAAHDQGGRTDDWACPDAACGRIVTDREYWFAVAAYEQEQAATTYDVRREAS